MSKHLGIKTLNPALLLMALHTLEKNKYSMLVISHYLQFGPVLFQKITEF